MTKQSSLGLAMENMFYKFLIKNTESYQSFLTRFRAAKQELKIQGVELPSEGMGWLLAHQMRLGPEQVSSIDALNSDWRQLETGGCC